MKTGSGKILEGEGVPIEFDGRFWFVTAWSLEGDNSRLSECGTVEQISQVSTY